MPPVKAAARLSLLLAFCVSIAGAAFFPPAGSSLTAAADCPAEAPEAPDEAPASQSGPLAENHEETAKHLAAWDFSHPLPSLLAGLAGSGAAPAGCRLPPPNPPPPDRATLA